MFEQMYLSRKKVLKIKKKVWQETRSYVNMDVGQNLKSI